MIAQEKTLVLCRRFEGLSLIPYLCPAGKWTIGYGHTGPDVTARSKPITKLFAETLLLEDATIATRSALRLSPVLAQHAGALAAIADFVFNLGAGRYAGSTLRRRVNARDWHGAHKEIRKWVYGGGKKLPGLILRREAEAKFFP